MESNYNLGTRLPEGEMYASGIAYVVIPPDLDRTKYIAECFRTSTVSVYSEHNGWVNRARVPKSALNFIEFPLKADEFGSPVSFTIDPVDNSTIIGSVFINANQVSDLEENQFKFKREFNGNFVEIVGSSNGKYLSFNVSADKGGEIKLNVQSKDQSAKVNIDVEGSVEINSAHDTILKQNRSLTLATVNKEDETKSSVLHQTDEATKINSQSIDHYTDSFRLNDGKEPYVLGNIFRKLFDEFIDEIAKTTVSTAIGQMPILNASQVAAFKEKTNTILSEVAFINK